MNLVAETQKAFGSSIHILVNVAGGLVARKLLEEMDADFWDHIMGLNVRSAFLASKHVVPICPRAARSLIFLHRPAVMVVDLALLPMQLQKERCLLLQERWQKNSALKASA
jgi:NAD(P)-dependent dehydrogenase (short-subunit alcohol dehydrogenase family)